MYADPAHIRKHTIKLSLSDQEYADLVERSRQTGQQLASLARELIFERMNDLEAHDATVSLLSRVSNGLPK